MRASLAWLVLALAPGLASAQSISTRVFAGGGYDSNPALAADPASRGRPERGVVASPDGAFVLGGSAELRLGALLPRQWDAFARFDLDGTIFGRGDALFWERLRLGLELSVDVLRFACSAGGARLDSGVSLDSGWGGDLACSVGARAPFGLWGLIEPSVAVRGYDQGQLDTIAGARAEVGSQHDFLLVAAGAGAHRRESDDRFASRTELAPSVRVRLAWDVAGGEARYQFVHREFDVGSRTGGEHVATFRLWARPWPFAGAFAELVLGYAEGKPQALAYDRVEVMAGLSAHFDWEAPRAPEPEPAEQGPAVLDGDGVRFEVVRPGAQEVSVVGSFNDWDPERGRLTRRPDGVFAGRFVIAPGRHTYQLLVDGEPVRPEGARRYVPDDFGGENAVLEVP
ncbi:MAG: hypothetical protein IT378_07590 [Sandaracinaceae bacterium]|nr:hypothetical protein [Sandaracinaceae bacterium]